jgi:dTDP-4-amino-4,6-dideoxy-D-galactose acyltransferase
LEIKQLVWDSEFFECSIASIHLNSVSENIISLLKNNLYLASVDLAYVYLTRPFTFSNVEMLIQSGAILVDEKITFQKQVSKNIIIKPLNVFEYSGKSNERLLELAYLAGHESRFNKDERLRSKFKTLYQEWLNNSLKGIIADKVFIYKRNDEILGMITCGEKNGSGFIGLIATSIDAQGMGVGSELVNAVEYYFQQSEINLINVVTQRTNVGACKFYENCEFKESSEQFVFHWWLA